MVNKPTKGMVAKPWVFPNMNLRIVHRQSAQDCYHDPSVHTLKQTHGYGSKLSQHRTAGFSLCFHLPGFYFWGYPIFDPCPTSMSSLCFSLVGREVPSGFEETRKLSPSGSKRASRRRPMRGSCTGGLPESEERGCLGGCLEEPFWDPILVGRRIHHHFRTGIFSGWIGMFTGGTVWVLTYGHMSGRQVTTMPFYVHQFLLPQFFTLVLTYLPDVG